MAYILPLVIQMLPATLVSPWTFLFICQQLLCFVLVFGWGCWKPKAKQSREAQVVLVELAFLGRERLGSNSCQFQYLIQI